MTLVSNFCPFVFNSIYYFREAKGAYALEVEARDGAPSARPNSGGQPNSVTKYIRIGIADKNDNPPYFDKHLYEAEVDENEDIQHTVLTVTANDKDECETHKVLVLFMPGFLIFLFLLKLRGFGMKLPGVTLVEPLQSKT